MYKSGCIAFFALFTLNMVGIFYVWLASAAAGAAGAGFAFNDTELDFRPAPGPPSILNQTSAYKQAADDDHDFYDPETWTLWTNQLRNNTFEIQPYSANGYIGVRIPVQGQGFQVDKNYSDPDGKQPVNGWPLDNKRFTGAYIGGFWDLQHNTTRTNFPELLKRGGESVIATLPQWTTLQLRDPDSKSVFDGKNVDSFYQGLSLKRGLVQTNVTWKPGHVAYKLNYTIVTHRKRPNLGIVRLDVTPDGDVNADLSDILDGNASMRTTFAASGDDKNGNAVWTSVHPHWTNVTGYEYSTLWFSDKVEGRQKSEWASKNNATVSQQFQVKLKKGQTFTAIKYVGIVSTDAYPKNTLHSAQEAAKAAKKDGWNKVLQEHEARWDKLWDEADIEIPSDQQLQISARATIFHLLSNVRDGTESHGFSDNSISVGGLSSDSYGGMVFWDADVWMNPGLSVLFPKHAASINNYRKRMRDQALKNAKVYNESGALYPWTSARYGNCTSTGPCMDYQYHLNIDIALAQWHYYLQSNDTQWLKDTGYPIMRDAANFFAGFVKKNGSHYETFNLTDPDEYANHVNNGAYTNGAIMQLMKWVSRASDVLGEKKNPKWGQIDMKIPSEKSLDLTLEFDGMNGTADIKQADVVMLQYPMEFNQTSKRAKSNLNYYARRQSPDGPAMTYAIFAVDTAELSTEGCSTYTYMLYSSQPYLRRPFYQFSEQLNDNFYTNGGTNPAFPFLTGHGGFLQVFTHGLTGYRPRQDALYLDPVLPPQIKDGVTIKGFKFQGGVFDVAIGLKETVITRRPDAMYSLTNTTNTTTTAASGPMIRIGKRNKKAGDYRLKVNETLTVPTFRSDVKTLFDKNIAECKPVSTKNEWLAGNFPFSVNDGDNSTSWQPLHTGRSELMVDLGKAVKFNSAYFLWGDEPPLKVSLGLPQGLHGTNVSKAEMVDKFYWILDDEKVKLSQPFNNKTFNASKITITPGNDSRFDFNSTYESRFVQIAIEGSHKVNATNGGRIAEFVLRNS